MDIHLIPRNRFMLFGSVVTLVLSACDYGPYEPVGKRDYGGLAGSGGPAVTTSIEGTWRRTLVFFDDIGFLHSTETTWTFEAGGTASRTSVTTNVAAGVSDTSLTLARWRIEGTNVIIDFTAPSPGSITLSVSVQGTTLFLAGQEYQRVT